MPRWARFLSCNLTGLALSLTGFVLVAVNLEWTPHFWSGLQDFLTTPQFWGLFWLFGLITVAGLLAARVLVHLTGLAASLAGMLTGAALAVTYLAFLLAAHASEWGGWAAAVPRFWPSAGWLGLSFALAGGFANWLWERLE